MPKGPDFPDPNRFVDYEAERIGILSHVRPLSVLRATRHALVDRLLVPGFNAALTVGHAVLRLDNREV